MKIHTGFEQQSLEWLVAKSGVITASEMDSLIDSKFELRTGKMPHTLLCQKVAEIWLGGPLPGFQTIDMEIGSVLEGEARPWLAFAMNTDIQTVPFITDDGEKIGCSPDGLIGQDGGCEIKCPKAETHVRYLLANAVPVDYMPQVHFSMFVTGRPWWKFVSYRRQFPALVVHVERDAEIEEKIQEALDDILPKIEAAVQKLENMENRSRRKKPVFEAKPKPQQDSEDGRFDICN